MQMADIHIFDWNLRDRVLTVPCEIAFDAAEHH